MLEDAYKDGDEDLVAIASGAVKAELMRPQAILLPKNNPRNKEIAEKLKTRSGI